MKYLLAAVTVLMALFAISLNVTPADAREQSKPCPLVNADVAAKPLKSQPECLSPVVTKN